MALSLSVLASICLARLSLGQTCLILLRASPFQELRTPTSYNDLRAHKLKNPWARSPTCFKLKNTKRYPNPGALRKDPLFLVLRSLREIPIQNASCQMGGREVQGRFFQQKTTSFCWDMSGREVTGRYISIPVFHRNSMTHGFLHPSVFPLVALLWLTVPIAL